MQEGTQVARAYNPSAPSDGLFLSTETQEFYLHPIDFLASTIIHEKHCHSPLNSYMALLEKTSKKHIGNGGIDSTSSPHSDTIILTVGSQRTLKQSLKLIAYRTQKFRFRFRKGTSLFS